MFARVPLVALLAICSLAPQGLGQAVDDPLLKKIEILEADFNTKPASKPAFQSKLFEKRIHQLDGKPVATVVPLDDISAIRVTKNTSKLQGKDYVNALRTGTIISRDKMRYHLQAVQEATVVTGKGEVRLGIFYPPVGYVILPGGESYWILFGDEQRRYETRQDHDPDGIGKFYLGREIAQVMSHFGAGWLDRPEREQEERVSKLLPSLKIMPGDVVADIGAGSGVYSLLLAAIVGAKGKVLANDIQPEMIAILKKKLKTGGVTNVEPILCSETDPNLPASAVDLILMVDVYHEFSHPYEVTLELVKSLKPGGRLVFVEFRLEDPKVPIKVLHKMTQKQVLKEMEPHPLRHVETLSHLPWQHVIIFEKKATANGAKEN